MRFTNYKRAFHQYLWNIIWSFLWYKGKQVGRDHLTSKFPYLLIKNHKWVTSFDPFPPQPRQKGRGTQNLNNIYVFHLNWQNWLLTSNIHSNIKNISTYSSICILTFRSILAYSTVETSSPFSRNSYF